MIANEFTAIKNIMEISKLYNYSDYHRIFLKRAEYNPESYIAARVLIDYCCKLSNKNTYPKSTELNDLIRFTEENDDVEELKNYFNYLKDYDEKKGTNQACDTYLDHTSICSVGLSEIRCRMNTFCEKNQLFNIENIESIYSKKTEDGNELYAKTQDETLKIEKVYGKIPNCFKIKGIIFERLTLSELINIINYSNCIQKLTLNNIQVAYNFLR